MRLTGNMPKDIHRYRELGIACNEIQSDIIAFQECWHGRTNDLFEELSGFEVAYGDRRPGRMLRASGLVTASRLPILSEKFYPFQSQGMFDRYSFWETYVRKGALHTVHQLESGDNLHVFNVHLASHMKADVVRVHQLSEVDALRRRVCSVGDRWAVLGDFNIGEERGETSLRLSGAIDTYRARLPLRLGSHSEIVGKTFDPGKNHYAQEKDHFASRLDRIFISPEETGDIALDVSRLFVDRPLSDHYGVRSKIYWIDPSIPNRVPRDFRKHHRQALAEQRQPLIVQ